jgi:molybdate transport system permease protein
VTGTPRRRPGWALPAVTGARRRCPGWALPAALTTLALVGLALMLVPVLGLVARAPWSALSGLATDGSARAALRLSLQTSLTSLLLCTLLGVPLAWLYARQEFPGKDLLRALSVLPMVLPPVVGGVALLLAFGRRGLVGRPLAELTGVTLPFTTAGVVLAETFVALPFLVVTVEAGLRALDTRYEEAAATLGASRWTVFRRVTLPLAAPSLGAGMALAWARALGEFGATITFAGNLPGRTQTLPLAVYLLLESRPEVAYLLSLILLTVSVAVLVGLRGRLLGAA